MPLRISLRVIIFSVCSFSLLIVYYVNYGERQKLQMTELYDTPETIHKNETASVTQAPYVIPGSQCKMLSLNPWDESVRKYLGKPRSVVCSYLPPLSHIDQLENSTYLLKINRKLLTKYKVNSNHSVKCCYSSVTRVNQDMKNYNLSADSLIQLAKCVDFEEQVLLPDETEFLLVKCRSYRHGMKSGNEFYKDMHPIVPMVPSALLKVNNVTANGFYEENAITDFNSKSDAKRLNVIILGIDSISKLNLKRAMPKTLNYLKANNWIELRGYNKVGENTFPNLMAILTGKPMSYLNKWWLNSSKPMDDCPFIWKDYSDKGYITLYAEDTPVISTFDSHRLGFVEKPTDYYLRPFMLAAHQYLRTKNLNGLPVCVGPILVVDHILNYAKRFYRKYKEQAHFSLLWLNSLSHNDLNAPKNLDITIYKFLNDLSKLGIYEESLVLVLSDHGVRFGDIRETLIGYIEERSPFLFMSFPKWFKTKHQVKYANLVINQDRLTSPFDIYVTLKNLLHGQQDGRNNFSDPSVNDILGNNEPTSLGCPKCNGLTKVQPLERVCSDASIDVNWCLCSEFRSVDVREKAAKQIGSFLYHHIVNRTNELIKKEKIKPKLCSKWKFVKIYRSHEIIERAKGFGQTSKNGSKIRQTQSEVNQAAIKIFVIIIELDPHRTKFESVVKINSYSEDGNPDFEFLEHPKRLDSIYKTSKCVNDTSLKHYCYCVRQ